MADAESTRDVLERWRQGEPGRAAALYRRFAERLVRVAEGQLASRLRPRLDGEDVVQSVFRTFFRRCADGQFQVDGADELWKLLVTITLRKARAKARFHTAAQRDVAAEAPGDDLLALAAAREPGPEDGAVLVDLLDAVVRDLPAAHREILHLRLEGCGVTEIAARLKLSRRTIQRVLNLLQQRLLEIDATP